MPTATGKLQLSDFDQVLQDEGFDGFDQISRYRFINQGYRYIARKFPFLWTLTSQTYTLNPGTPSISITGTGNPGSADIIKEVFCITTPYRRKLEIIDQDSFMQKWFPLDLTSLQSQSIPTEYFFWAGSLYILPPPNATMQFTVWFNQFLSDMVNATDTSVFPQNWDELVLDAARVRCHRRAKELELAGEAQARVQEALDDLLMDEAMREWDLPERVRPDDQWL